MTDKELLRQALEALEFTGLQWTRIEDAINALRDRLAQPERPTFAEWTGDYVRDNLHKLKNNQTLDHDWHAAYRKAVELHSLTLDELRQSDQYEREGWRYADELEQERKVLQAMLNEERDKSEARIAALEDEAKRLRSVMAAAAETISSKWEAHCDEDGYGPVNLLRRLEKGIAADYGYTVEAFAVQKAHIAASERLLKENQ